MILPLATLIITAEKFPLTIESIMRGYALVGHAPRNLKWSEDGSQVGFSWAKADGTQNPPTKSYVVDADGKNLKEGTVSERRPEEWEGGSKLDDEIVYAARGDIFRYNTTTKKSDQLTQTPEDESRPVYARNGKSVVFTRGGELFRLTLADRKEAQLTQHSGSNPPKDDIPVNILPPKGFNAASGFQVSPSGTYAAVNLFQAATGRVKNAEVAKFITGSSYVELVATYPRVGAPQSHSEVAFYNLTTGTSSVVEIPRPGVVSRVEWSPNGKFGIFWGLSEDHKDAWLYQFNTENGYLARVYDEHDAAWVGGAWSPMMGWLSDSSKFYFLSENSGFANLMTMDPTNKETVNLTPGSFEVSDIRLDEDHQRFLFVSTEGSPYDRHLDSVALSGGPRRKLADLSADDDSQFEVSPDGTKVAVVRSFTNRPPELFVNNIQVTESPTKEWLSGPWIDAPIITYPSRDGLQIPAKLYKPKNWRRGGPAVVFVHGAGYLQNVFHGWSYYFREYMFHHYLMSKGYAVLDVDYRASSGYGKAWRTAIYRHMGGKDLDDVVDGAQYLVKELGASKDRLGVYGGSYGGFLTLMAMFTAPDVFKAGAALRPVGDWANYHHGYTSPILNTPQEDPEAYKVSSPINFVDGLKGNLLICHGMVDTNVQFQDSVRIVEKLIELGKKNWSVAPYPVEDHSFVRPESWTDEYNRIFDLFERTIGSKRK